MRRHIIIRTIKATSSKQLPLELLSAKLFIYHHFITKTESNQVRLKGDNMNSEAFSIASLWWNCDGVDVTRWVFANLVNRHEVWTAYMCVPSKKWQHAGVGWDDTLRGSSTAPAAMTCAASKGPQSPTMTSKSYLTHSVEIGKEQWESTSKRKVAIWISKLHELHQVPMKRMAHIDNCNLMWYWAIPIHFGIHLCMGFVSKMGCPGQNMDPLLWGCHV